MTRHHHRTKKCGQRHWQTPVLLFLALLLTACTRNPPNSSTNRTQLTVAAAADLQPALEEIGRAFEATHNASVVFSFGSTGMLTRQIENGAPVDLFAAANTDYIEQLEKQGLILSDTKVVYARGRITLWTPKDSTLRIEKVSDLTRKEITLVAIANPDHAPYGMAARDALMHEGIWESIKPKLVYGENIRQTLQYAETGNVDVAIVALSLSKQSDGHWVLIPESLHSPINQSLAVIKGTKSETAARELASFISSPKGREILQKYGFEFADEK